MYSNGSFRQLRIHYFGVLTKRTLLFSVLYEDPKSTASHLREEFSLRALAAKVRAQGHRAADTGWGFRVSGLGRASQASYVVPTSDLPDL